MPPWPNFTKAAISFTMDNLGEAQDVNKGLWHDPIGTHYSVTNQLPQMLDLLSKHQIKATYFAEAWSLDTYPDTIKEITLTHGHEIAWHGYQHEVWSSLSEQEETENFSKSFEKAAEHGIRYKGFRPPGGRVNQRTWRLLRERGVEYISPLGEFGIVGDKSGEGKELVVLPFEWRAVDAFYYMEKFARIREEHGEQRGVLKPREFERVLMEKIDQTVRDGGYLSVLFHPFLQMSEEKIAVMERVLERISGREEIWCAPCGEVAKWVVENRESFRVVNME